MTNSIKYLLLATLISLFAIVHVQEYYPLFKIAPLNGSATVSQKPTLSISNWFSGNFQTNEDSYLSQNFGFRNIVIRLYNQIDFSLFHQVHASGVVAGKEGYLYEQNYIDAYYGEDFIGEDSIKTSSKRLKKIQDTLKTMGKNLIVVLAPGKASFYPEYLPKKAKKSTSKTNHQTYLKSLSTLRVLTIDFHTMFIQQKGKTQYPLYAKNGIHWSYYGLCIAADSMVNFVESTMGKNIPNLFWTEIAEDNEREYD
jgi:uncharacterized protein YutE (UPF0331/DUF86 family)